MARKNTRELYRGAAVIMGVSMEGVEDWKEWERRDLPEADTENAFKAVYDVAEGDANGARHEVKIEISHRELRGKMLDFYSREDGTTPTQIDVALKTLRGQGLVEGTCESALAGAVDDSLIGRTVTIRAFEEEGNDGRWWPRCTFASKFQRISGADKAVRMAAFLAGVPAPKANATPAPNANAIPAPAEGEELPF